MHITNQHLSNKATRTRNDDDMEWDFLLGLIQDILFIQNVVHMARNYK